MTLRTGIYDAEGIIGSGEVRGMKSGERLVLLCEGEDHDTRVGEDKLVLSLVADEYEIYCCGKKKETLRVLDNLRKHGSWKSLVAVVDLDEDREKKDQGVIYWPGSRDLESFLISTKAFDRALNRISGQIDSKMCPDPIAYREGGIQTDLEACAMAWQMHDGKSFSYQHVKWDSDFVPEFLMCLVEREHLPEKLPEEKMALFRYLINASDEVLVAPPSIEDVFRKIQGKRALSLISARIFSETKLNMENLKISHRDISHLWKSLRMVGYCTNLRGEIVSSLERADLSNLESCISNSSW